MICRALAAVVFCSISTLSLAADAFTSDIPPFSSEQGPRVGFVREMVVEVGKRLGSNVTIVYGQSWPKSQEEAKSLTDTLTNPRLAGHKRGRPSIIRAVQVIDSNVHRYRAGQAEGRN